MNKEIELYAPQTANILLKLTIIGGLLLGFVYGFLVLFNSALEALK